MPPDIDPKLLRSFFKFWQFLFKASFGLFVVFSQLKNNLPLLFQILLFLNALLLQSIHDHFEIAELCLHFLHLLMSLEDFGLELKSPLMESAD